MTGVRTRCGRRPWAQQLDTPRQLGEQAEGRVSAIRTEIANAQCAGLNQAGLYLADVFAKLVHLALTTG